MHLIVDGYCSNRALLEDEGFLQQFLEAYPSRIGMTRISEPSIIRYEEGDPQEWGISGFVFLAESHVSVHTFAQRDYVNIDVFSCKDFDTDAAVDDLRARFLLTHLRTCVIDREWSGEAVGAIRPTFTHHGQ